MQRLLSTLLVLSLTLGLALGLAGCGSAEKSVRRGDAALALGEYAEAAALYKKAYSQTPPKNKAQRGQISRKMADAYGRYGNLARAIGAWRNVQRYCPSDGEAILVLARQLQL